MVAKIEDKGFWELVDTRLLPLSVLEHNNGQVQGIPENPRFLNDENRDKLKKSLTEDHEFLSLNPLSVYEQDGKYVVMCGNMRLHVARELGYSEIPCQVIPNSWSKDKIIAYMIKDNVSCGEWDHDILANQFNEKDLLDWGVPAWDTDAFFGDEENGEEGGTEEDDFDPNQNVETRVKSGDVWRLGQHRLICGDSMNTDTYERLMKDERADICFTSPPYNMGVSNISDIESKAMAVSGNSPYKNYKDNVSCDEYTRLLCDVLENSLKYSDDVLFNIGILKGSKDGIINMLDKFREKFLTILYWHKNTSLPMGLPSQHGKVSNRVEPIFCFTQKTTMSFSHPQWNVGNMTNVIQTENASRNEYAKEHGATFPVAFAGYIVDNFSKNMVLDPFGGTGTTLIACEQLNRQCRMIELDPHCCDIIIKRWEEYTGNTAVKIVD